MIAPLRSKPAKRWRIRTPEGFFVPGMSVQLSSGGESVVSNKPLRRRYALVMGKPWEQLERAGYRVVLA